MSIQLKKILRDLLSSRGKSFIVILSVLTGIVGTGVIGHTGYILDKGMKDSLETFQPASGTIAFQQFDESFVEKVKDISGVQTAEARITFDSEIYMAQEKEWKRTKLFVIDKDDPNTLDVMLYKESEAPKEGEILLERLSFPFLQMKPEDQVLLKSNQEVETSVKITGSVHHGGLEATPISSVAYGYVSKETAADLGMSTEKNLLLYKTETKDKETVEKIESKIRDLAQTKGYTYLSSTIHNNKHWGYDIVKSMENILISLGLLTILLSTCLIINTILSIIKSQIPQIGIMKVIGASGSQLQWLYLCYIIVYSLIALLLGIPISLYLAKVLSSYSYVLLSFTTKEVTYSMNTLLIQIGIGLGLPIISGLIPVMNGVRISIYDALTKGSKQSTKGFPSWLLTIPWISRPFLFIIRDTLQRKFRFFLTVVTLSIGGAIVISVLTVYQSLLHTVDESLKYEKYDLQVVVSGTSDKKQLEEVSFTDNVQGVEIWNLTSGSFVNGDIRSGYLSIVQSPITSSFMEPKIIEGRWLKEHQSNEIVLDSYFLKSYPSIRVGDYVSIEVNGEPVQYKVVGKFRKVSGAVVQYVNNLGPEFTPVTSSFMVNIKAQEHSVAEQNRLKENMKRIYSDNQIPIITSHTFTEIKEMQEARVNIVTVFLIGMAIILVIVAMLGLIGTLSLNVSERSKSIAIMKLIGGGDMTLWRMIMAESLLIGLICFFISIILAYPFSKILCNKVGQSLFLSDLDFSFSILGILIWFLMVIVLSLVASFIPAYKATKISISKALAYE